MTQPERERGVIPDPQQAKDQRIEKVDSPGEGEYGQTPDLGARVVVGVFDSREAAEAAARALRATHGDHVSLVAPQVGQAPETSADETGANAGAVTGLAAGAAAGAALLGLISLAVPGVGIILAAGPIGAALGGAALGGALGGLIGALNGLGVPSEQARQYEAAVRAGKSIVTVRAADSAGAEATERALREQGATAAHSYQDAL